MSTTLQQKAKDDKTALDKLRKIFEEISKSKASISEKRRKNFTKVLSLVDEDSIVLQDIYSDVGASLCGLEDSTDRSKDKIDNKILPGLQYIDMKNKEFTDEIKGIKKEEETLQSLRQDKVKAQQNRNNEKAMELQNEIAQLEEQINEEKKNNPEGVILYEKDRIINTKLALLHYIHAELEMHLHSIDLMSKLYRRIVEKKPLDDLNAFAVKYCGGEEHGLDLAQYGYKEEKKKPKSKPKSKIPKPASVSENKSSMQGSRQMNVNIGGDEIPNQNQSINLQKNVGVGPINFAVNAQATSNSKPRGSKTNSKVAEDDEFEV